MHSPWAPESRYLRTANSHTRAPTAKSHPSRVKSNPGPTLQGASSFQPTNASTSQPIMASIYDRRDPLCPRFPQTSSIVAGRIRDPAITPVRAPAPPTPPLRLPPPVPQVARTCTTIPRPYAPSNPPTTQWVQCEKRPLLAEFRQCSKENRCVRTFSSSLTARSNCNSAVFGLVSLAFALLGFGSGICLLHGVLPGALAFML